MNPDMLRQASQALRRGEVDHARSLVAQVLLAEPRNEQAWLLLARLVKERVQVIECLERAHTINPGNLATLAALGAIRRAKPATGVQPASPATVISDIRDGATPGLPGELLTQAEAKPISERLPRVNRKNTLLPKHKLNGALIIGSFLVLMVIVVAFLGPKLAPHDPMEEHGVFRVGDTFLRPPLNAFQVSGYILGTDLAGRDMLSRLMYAVRPTMIMVSLVAIVRLFLGTVVGLLAGWLTGRPGHFLNGLISAALTVPTLLIALAAITVIGIETGLVAFIVGLSLNGWGETARLVHGQTRLIKKQLFIESARSLGASTYQILTRHILRQIMPMIWMLFAFEISATLMTTAGLGFLGYYIGGDVWLEWADFVSRRTSGPPELGQMLATSWTNLLQAWPLVMTGLVIFVTVLGFNLLGEGLRSRLDPSYINRNNAWAMFTHRFSMWYEASVSFPTGRWFKANRWRPVLVPVVIISLAASIYFYKTKYQGGFDSSQAILAIPGGQAWASEKADPYGTYYVNYLGPSNPVRLWEISNPDGFSGTPVVSSEGMVYVAGLDGVLYAYQPDGTIRWQVSLPEKPIGPLTLGPQGTIYVTDIKAGLSAISPDGVMLWTYPVQVNGKPNHGAIVDHQGTIYYLIENQLGDILVALQPNGQLLWYTKPGTHAAATGLRLSPDGTQIFIKDVVVNAKDGSPVDLALPTKDDIVLSEQAHLLVGADGKTYLLAGHQVLQWQQGAQGFELIRRIDWNFRGEGFNQSSNLPQDGGVTPRGDVWLFYSGLYGGASVYWLDPTGKILGSYTAQLSKSAQLVAIDGEETIYTCRTGFTAGQGVATMCEAYRQDIKVPAWSYTFYGNVQGIVGAAMAPGRLYVITSEGTLTALGDANNTQSGSPNP